jgi:hypothetical protein
MRPTRKNTLPPKHGRRRRSRSVSWSSSSILFTLHCYALDDHVLSNFIDMSTYWARLDNIMLTWILGTLFIKLYEVIHEL